MTTLPTNSTTAPTTPPPSGMKGRQIILDVLATLTDSAGVYRMLDENSNVLYVGKARDLKKRVHNYTQLDKLSPRIARMVSLTRSMEIVTTRTEAEALLLEASLIKGLKPRYNILLRDDKSFPYITLTNSEYSKSHPFPRIAKHRGAKKPGYHYFGPYASAGAVNDTIATLQKAFLLRPCSDSEFKRRTRPCMEHQIKRCSAPCVGLISKEDYAVLSQQTIAFLSGKSHDVQQQLTKKMEEYSADMDYERAALYRDRIQALISIQASQGVMATGINDADIIAIASESGQSCIQAFFIRSGQTCGHHSWFPDRTEEMDDSSILEAFLAQFYQQTPAPALLITSHELYGKAALEEALHSLTNTKVSIITPQKGEKRLLVETAITNAKEALARKLQEKTATKDALYAVMQLFHLKSPPKRIEIYDNSHIFGQHAVGGMVVAGTEGFIKQAYRKFTVDPGDKTTGGDDYYMLQQVLTRRFKYLKEENSNNTDGMSTLPDLLLIDGGAGHLTAALHVMKELKLEQIPLVCISKGPDRNAGREQFHQKDRPPFSLPMHDPALYYLQRLRDEAHRFAINAHRKKRNKNITSSLLDEIPGIGPNRRKALLHHFGSVRGIEQATLVEIKKTPGISSTMAHTIHDYFHA